MKRGVTAAVLCVLASGVLPLAGQVISKADHRETITSSLETLIDNESGGEMGAIELRTPFVLRTEVLETSPFEENPIAGPEPGPDAPAPVVRVLPDSQALAAISERFKPVGSLVMGGRGVLQLANGVSLAEGRSFRAEIHGITYSVKITKVTAEGYRLELGKAAVEQNFIEPGVTKASKDGSISPDQ
jgi:hypothetical protein